MFHCIARYALSVNWGMYKLTTAYTVTPSLSGIIVLFVTCIKHQFCNRVHYVGERPDSTFIWVKMVVCDMI